VAETVRAAGGKAGTAAERQAVKRTAPDRTRASRPGRAPALIASQLGGAIDLLGGTEGLLAKARRRVGP
jgi:hypothetical protein